MLYLRIDPGLVDQVTELATAFEVSSNSIAEEALRLGLPILRKEMIRNDTQGSE